MSTAEKWFDLLIAFHKDSRLTIWHLALLHAIVLLAYNQNEEQIVRVSRSKLMQVSHIDTISTYHRYFKQLEEFGYIIYYPSYHPGYRSTVEINLKTISSLQSS